MKVPSYDFVAKLVGYWVDFGEGLESTKQVLLTLQPVTNVNKNVPGGPGADLAQHISFVA